MEEREGGATRKEAKPVKLNWRVVGGKGGSKGDEGGDRGDKGEDNAG